jgi:hypothetical protein
VRARRDCLHLHSVPQPTPRDRRGSLIRASAPAQSGLRRASIAASAASQGRHAGPGHDTQVYPEGAWLPTFSVALQGADMRLAVEHPHLHPDGVCAADEAGPSLRALRHPAADRFDIVKTSALS